MNPFNRSQIASLVFMCLSGVACANNASDDAGKRADVALEPHLLVQREVASAQAAGVTVKFMAEEDEDGQTTISLQEHGSAYASTSPVPGLIAQGLTSLEIYLALAPEGSEAPALLSAVHAAEAEHLGRDAAVRRVGLDPVPPVQKDLKACRSKLFVDIASWAGAGTWTRESSSSFAAGLHTQSVGGSLAVETQAPVVFGVCNESPSTSLTTIYGYLQRWNNQWYQSPAYELGAGGYYVWYYRFGVPASCYNTGSQCIGDCINATPGPEGICFPHAGRGASYYINADSFDAYDLMTAIWQTTITPPK